MFVSIKTLAPVQDYKLKNETSHRWFHFLYELLQQEI